MIELLSIINNIRIKFISKILKIKSTACDPTPTLYTIWRTSIYDQPYEYALSLHIIIYF